MSELQIIMKFELLPNEILRDCFEYLNIFDIFYSFNHLNNHFNQLIQTIPLHLHFQSIQKCLFDKFCQLILLNPQIKNQIYSLTLSNQYTYGQINAFLSFFSLIDFSHLQSLTLIQVKKENTVKLQTMLPLIPHLTSFHLHDSDDMVLNCSLPSNLQILTIPTLSTSQISLTKLTISFCSFAQLLKLLIKHTPMLTYLNVHYITEQDSSMTDECNIKAIHLRELILGNFEHKFKDFEYFVKYIPQLTSLELYGNYDIDMIDAKRWKNLILTSLSYLENFKFIFNYIYRTKNDHIFDKLNEFQDDFWLKQHQWYTEYSISDYSASLYTVPYIMNSFTLEIPTKRYWNKIFNTFDNVTNLTLYHGVLKETCEYYFSYVNSLTLLPSEEYYKPNLGNGTIKTLGSIVNLSNIKHLGLSVKFRLKDPGVLIRILHECSQLSSLGISVRALETFSYDKDLCELLKKMIKKLDIYKPHSSSFKYHHQINDFCQTFSNLQQLRCNIDQTKDLLYLLHHLPELINLQGYLWKINDHHYFYSWLKKKIQTFNPLFRMKYIDKYETELSIWINRTLNKK